MNNVQRNAQYSPTVFCPPPSTSVEKPLQIGPFMQNKPNFKDTQMNVNLNITKAYENKYNWTLGQSKPNSNPISNAKKSRVISSSPSMRPVRCQTERRMTHCSLPWLSRERFPIKCFLCSKMMYLTLTSPKKQNQFKPNFFKGQNELKIACQKIWPHPTHWVRRKIVEIERGFWYRGYLSA